jgi:hypothetical protein
MGGEPWMYFVPYQSDVSKALRELRYREFAAGRYYPAVDRLWNMMPIGPNSPSPGASHASIEDAMQAAGEDGTKSILDMMRVSEEPAIFAVSPMDEEALVESFGSPEPTRAEVEDSPEFFDGIERGQGVYAVVYKDGRPDEILFAGYSFD